MQNYNKNRVKNYLIKFNEILSTMGCKMLFKSNCDEITVYFINCMIPHHQAAIYMCENLLKYTKYEPLQCIAKNIINMQEQGVKQMREIKNTTKGYTNSKEDVKEYTEKYCKIVREMLYKMKKAPKCIDINLNFVNEMIPHHEGAVKMCENLLNYDIDPRLVDVAKKIIKEQSNGIKELEKIRENLI